LGRGFQVQFQRAVPPRHSRNWSPPLKKSRSVFFSLPQEEFSSIFPPFPFVGGCKTFSGRFCKSCDPRPQFFFGRRAPVRSSLRPLLFPGICQLPSRGPPFGGPPSIGRVLLFTDPRITLHVSLSIVRPFCSPAVAVTPGSLGGSFCPCFAL